MYNIHLPVTLSFTPHPNLQTSPLNSGVLFNPSNPSIPAFLTHNYSQHLVPYASFSSEFTHKQKAHAHCNTKFKDSAHLLLRAALEPRGRASGTITSLASSSHIPHTHIHTYLRKHVNTHAHIHTTNTHKASQEPKNTLTWAPAQQLRHSGSQKRWCCCSQAGHLLQAVSGTEALQSVISCWVVLCNLLVPHQGGTHCVTCQVCGFHAM